jgi:hypothetical protein
MFSHSKSGGRRIRRWPNTEKYAKARQRVESSENYVNARQRVESSENYVKARQRVESSENYVSARQRVESSENYVNASERDIICWWAQIWYAELRILRFIPKRSTLVGGHMKLATLAAIRTSYRNTKQDIKSVH